MTDGGRDDERMRIEAEFHRGILTLRALPDREVGYLARAASSWPAYARHPMDAYEPEGASARKFNPTPRDVAAMLERLAWGMRLSKREWAICRMRAGGASFRTIGDYLNVSHETARLGYRDAIDEVWRAANAAPARAGAAAP